MTNVEVLTMSDSSYKYYTSKVKGNAKTSRNMASLKLTRNRELALCYKRDNSAKKNPRAWYGYGSLRFMVQDNEVKWIENDCANFPMWYLDWDKYVKLSEELGIDEKHVKIKKSTIHRTTPVVPATGGGYSSLNDKKAKVEKKSWINRLLKLCKKSLTNNK